MKSSGKRIWMLLTLLLAAMAIAGAKDGGNCTLGQNVREREMEHLPLGCVRPQGWLREQLEMQRDGLTGHAEELYKDIGKSDWLTGGRRGGQYAWERGPYYAKGLVSLAFVLDDDGLKAKAKRWIDAFLASQRENGDFGPKNRNWWANMIVLWTLRDWCEATDDERVVPFMERYFAFQRGEFAAGHGIAKDSAWARARAGDEADVALWLWRKTGKNEWLAFAREVILQAADWTDYYLSGGDGGWDAGYRTHIVNYMQGLKTPPLKWLMGGDEKDRTAFAAALAPNSWAMKKCGRPDRTLNGTEPLSSRSTSQGTELCATAEHILSAQVALEILGDAQIADDLEVAAYNTLPATLSGDGKGLRYYCLLNQPTCVNEDLAFSENGKGYCSTVPGPYSGFGCCRSNFHLAWPKFVQSMWMAKDGGLAAVAYGDSTVMTPLATIAETGGWPFADGVRLEIVETAGGEWPLFVRIPGWCKTPVVKVNGEAVRANGKFTRIARKWKKGDVVELEFPAEVSITHWKNDTLAVSRGPLLYALKIAAEEKILDAAEVKRIKDDNGGHLPGGEMGFPIRELRAASPWNWALVAETKDAEPEFEVRGSGSERRLAVKAVRMEQGRWGKMRKDAPGRAEDPSTSPLRIDDATGPVETIELVPIAFTQLRITLFPWTFTGKDGFGAEDFRVRDPFILADGADKVRGWFDSFAETDNELYTNAIPNAAAAEWALANIPRFECPDKEIERTYYFRWWTYRKHLKETKYGWVVTEFLPNVPWAAKENTISCALNHHIAEGKWLRDRKYLDGYIRFMLTKGRVNGHGCYACAPAYAALERARVTGDYGFVKALLPLFVKNCEKWENGWYGRGGSFFIGYRPERGLYDIYGDREGTEYNLSANGARPMVNSMRWADLDATAKIAEMVGEKESAAKFRAKADALETVIKGKLWNKDERFFTTLSRKDGTLDNVCELHGYAPFYFGMPVDPSWRCAFSRLVDDEHGFAAPKGLTFPARDTKGFKTTPNLMGHECQWNGPSWPYATSVALTALARQLKSHGEAGGMTKEDFARLLNQYAAQHEITLDDGRRVPWVDEDYDPFTGEWLSRKVLMHRAAASGKPLVPRERGKDYNHSTFCDLVISGLCGIGADAKGELEVKPLAPESWDWWCLEGVRWHRRDVTVLFDRDGTHYGKGRGLIVVKGK